MSETNLHIGRHNSHNNVKQMKLSSIIASFYVSVLCGPLLSLIQYFAFPLYDADWLINKLHRGHEICAM